METIQVLVVSDNHQDINRIVELLSATPGSDLLFHVKSEGDYNGALKALVRNAYDVYLVDQIVQNTKMSGIDLVKKANVGGCRSPVLLLTTMSDEDIDWAVEDSGAMGHVNKNLDFTWRTFRNAIRFAIRYHKNVLGIQKQLTELQRQVADLITKFNHRG